MAYRTAAALALLATLTGCGGTLVAPEGPASNAFLDQVAAACGKHSIGKQPINYLLDVNSNDVTFLDETAKLSAGTLTPAAYRNAINSFYPTGDNGPGIDCVIAQLD